MAVTALGTKVATQATGSSLGSFGSGLSVIYENPFIMKLLQVLLAIVITGVLLFLSKFIANIIKNKITKHFKFRHQESVDKVANLVGDLVFYAMSVFSIYIGFKIVGIDFSLLMGGISIGIGFAFKEVLSNLVAGMEIFSTKEFKIGDIVQVSSKVEHPDKKEVLFGRIEEITIRYIVVRTFDLRRIVIPSLKFVSSTVKTYTSEDIIRDDVDFTVDIGSDITKTIEALKKTINELPYISNKDYTDIIITGYDMKLIKMQCIYAFDPNAGALNHTIASTVLQKIIETLRSSEFKIK